MALSKIKGENFRAFVGGSAIAEALSCECSINGNMQDERTMDSEGMMNQEGMVSKSWQVNVTHQDASVATLKALITAFIAAQPVTVGWDETTTTAGGQNRTAASAEFARSGSAILSDLNITANDREKIQVSCTYTGTGALS